MRYQPIPTARRTNFYYASQSKSCTKYTIQFLLLIICLTVVSFTIVELCNFYADEPIVQRILVNSLQSSKSSIAHNKLVSLEQQNNSERQIRAAADNNTNSTKTKSNSYYEEQNPVVVYSKTDIDPTIAERQMAEVPPRQDADDEGFYGDVMDDDYENSDNNDNLDYLEPQGRAAQPSQDRSQPYYKPQPSSNYYRDQTNSYENLKPPLNPTYYDDSTEEAENSEGGRSSQYRNNYRQYSFANPSPGLMNNRRLSPVGGPGQHYVVQQHGRDPYPNYIGDYEYQSPDSSYPATAETSSVNNWPPQSMPQYRTPVSAALTKESKKSSQQMNILTLIKSVKTMWDLYQAFTSSWKALIDKRNRELESIKQKQTQLHKIRINSKKPPKFNSKKNATVAAKSTKQQTTTTTSTMETPTTYNFDESNEKIEGSTVKVEPRKTSKGEKRKRKERESFREKRQAVAESKEETTDVSKGRYIKGDPLKGYYDFVITEGSYKFWAAFQVGTAILIIYSTFAAIYYSKVNPLVSDYDYTDYLGGARSLGGDEYDFIDDDNNVTQKRAETKSWLDWLPRTDRSIKFILNAIDKLPTDHAAIEERTEANINNDVEVTESTEEIEYMDETQPVVVTENVTENEQINENDYKSVSETPSVLERERKAM